MPTSRRRFLAGLAHTATALPFTSVQGAEAPENWVYLDNGTIRLGVKRSSGAGIAWLSASGSKENLLDHFDHGRLIQQSY
jgi:hypothetical protein